MLCSEIPQPLQGKAVEMDHFMFDALWNYGNKKIPAILSRPAATICEPSQPQEVCEESKGNNSTTPEQLQASQQEEEKEEVIPADEMDPRIIEAFYRSCLESVKDSMLPMEPSDFLKNHLSEYSCS